jgi:hypothetical protein
VQDVVVLVHERVAHLRARANRIESALADQASGLGGRPDRSHEGGGRAREVTASSFAYHLRRRGRRSGGGRRRRHGQGLGFWRGGVKREGFVAGSAREFLPARLRAEGERRERRRGVIRIELWLV